MAGKVILKRRALRVEVMVEPTTARWVGKGSEEESRLTEVMMMWGTENLSCMVWIAVLRLSMSVIFTSERSLQV